jgi:hypothetical protein
MSENNVKIYTEQGGATQVVASGGEIKVESGGIINAESGSIQVGVVLSKRQRITDAQINAGVVVLPALTGYTYRMVACKAIAIGGALNERDSLDILGDDGSAATLVSYAKAQLLENVVIDEIMTGGTVLAAGASYVANTAGVAISAIGVGGSTETTADAVDVIITYVIEKA